jgi:hypothetical protein
VAAKEDIAVWHCSATAKPDELRNVADIGRATTGGISSLAPEPETLLASVRFLPEARFSEMHYFERILIQKGLDHAGYVLASDTLASFGGSA